MTFHEKDKLYILGTTLDRVDYELASKRVETYLQTFDNKVIVTPNAEIIMEARKNPLLQEAINGADLCLPDGIGVVIASRILGNPLTERTTGFDFLLKILSMANKKNLSIFLLGGKLGVAEEAAQKIKQRFEGIRFAGIHHGYFKDAEEEAIVEIINRSEPDILIVAMGAPRQELFMMRNRAKLKFRIAMGVGGSLDVISGNVKRAPVFMQETGLEWLYRLISQPSRFRRVGTLPLFIIKVVIESLLRGGRKTH